MKLTDFRIVEYLGKFTIQRRDTELNTITWKPITIYGDYVYSSFFQGVDLGNRDLMLSSFNYKEDAIVALDAIIEGKKYHYFDEQTN